MVNDLQELMRENVAAPPPDRLDLHTVRRAGRRRVRVRRTAVGGGAAALVLAVVAGVALIQPGGDGDRTDVATEPPAPDAPTITLADAEQALEGRDYRVLESYTNKDLDRDNGQYFDGVTDDGLILFRDGPREGLRSPRLALLDPRTGERDRLPDLDLGQAQTRPVQLGTDRLVLLGGEGRGLVAHVFDRATRRWSSITWPTLPGAEPFTGTMAPDGRLYVSVPNTRGEPPEGGWPTGPDGEADDSDAEGDTYRLWSVSLTDAADVRDEDLTFGDVAFTDSAMVWTDSTNGAAGMVHVRDLASGEESSFDPRSGERCNLLSFGVTDDRVVLGQYCGDYAGGVRDDRVQVLTLDGEQVVTLQDSGIEGGIAATGGDNPIVTVSSDQRGRSGTYVYDLESGRFLRITRDLSSFWLGGPAPTGQFLWHTPVNNRHGATQWLGELLT